jgi:Xaa-Pro dipeptidase
VTTSPNSSGRSTTEHERVHALCDAERMAGALFDEVVRRGLIVPGVGERELSDQIRALANEMFDVRRFWHKRVVRAGLNSVEPYASNPPDRRLEHDDIVFLDFGPLFAEWEADFGRTYVLGDDPLKHRLVADLPRLWELGRTHFVAHPDITGAQLYDFVTGQITAAGWKHATPHAGHLIGEFPHERINGDEIVSYIAEGSDGPMRRPDAAGRACHWILEIHLVEPDGRFGGFFEQLLDIAPE